jgi:hypothetical protein
LLPVACIIDMAMDGKECVETLFELQGLANKPKLIAFPQNLDYLELVDDLVDALLLKPVMFEQLQNTLAKLGIETSDVEKQSG